MPALRPESTFQIAERMLGRRPDRFEAFRPGVGGGDSYAYRLWVGREAMLLKVKKQPGSPIGIYFHSRLQAEGIPVPKLIAFQPNAGPNGEACAIWEWIEGLPAEWGPGQPCPYDEASLGTLLRRLHSLRFDGAFGFLGDDLQHRDYTPDAGLGPVSARWSRFFHCDSAAQHYLENGYLDPHEAELLSKLPERMQDALDQAEPRLLHMGDLMHSGNLIVEPGSGRILAIVDYVEAMAGDPLWELAWFQYYFAEYPFAREPFNLERFWEAYGVVYDPQSPLARFYLAAILLFEKLRFYDPASPRGQWAILTVKDILRGFNHTGNYVPLAAHRVRRRRTRRWPQTRSLALGSSVWVG